MLGPFGTSLFVECNFAFVSHSEFFPIHIFFGFLGTVDDVGGIVLVVSLIVSIGGTRVEGFSLKVLSSFLISF